ncbi:T9SS type A sorting domain-containing protein [Carboxylicivirga sediminis]|uniref:T9SS type A sorting domain-containing protein n=1 Tax=Carboxylicivirga sediminis TaxID=2006564 RepID=A0A941F215_9BACT|nr:T9SS type A sorting domain-containing protein [Carboxylicivirga sediminis]
MSDYVIITSEQLNSRYINIQLYNISGQVVYSEKRFFNSSSQRINFPVLSEGIYLLEVSDNKKAAVKKIIIQ